MLFTVSARVKYMYKHLLHPEYKHVVDQKGGNNVSVGSYSIS